jgi:hypothetical protein
LGKAPLIEDLLGTATFTEEEISAMKLALEKYGINLPSFGKIGGILANEMSVDEAAVHAAVMAINEVLEKEDSDETLKALQNPAACLVDVQAENALRYQVTLLTAKRDKTAKAGAQNGDIDDSERDVYEYMLTQDEIQKGITDVNAKVRAEIAEEKCEYMYVFSHSHVYTHFVTHVHVYVLFFIHTCYSIIHVTANFLWS